MVITRIVDDQDHLSAPGPVGQELAEELPERCGAEDRGLQRDQSSVTEVDGTEERQRLPRGRVQQHRIRIFGGNPHDRPSSVLLEMTFIEAPQINSGMVGQAAEFFYIASARPGPPGQ